MSIDTGRPDIFGATLRQNGLSVILLDTSSESFASVPYNASITVVDTSTHSSIVLQAVIEFDQGASADRPSPRTSTTFDERMGALFARSTKRDEVTAAQTVISLLMDKFNPEIASASEEEAATMTARFEVTEVELIAFNQRVVNGCYLTTVALEDSDYGFEVRRFKERDSTFAANLRLEHLPITTPYRQTGGFYNGPRYGSEIETYFRDQDTQHALFEAYATDNADTLGDWDGFIFTPKYTPSSRFQAAEFIALNRDGGWRVFSRSNV